MAHHDLTARALPSADELRRLFDLNIQTGVLTRKPRDDISPSVNKRCSGKLAGYTNQRGYIQVGIGDRLFLAHRIVWKMYYGVEPPREIDHIDGNPSNNAPSNPRCANRQQQNFNRKRKAGKVSPKGVYPMKRSYQAKITIGGTTHHLGCYPTPEMASEAYQAAAAKFHGPYASTQEAA